MTDRRTIGFDRELRLEWLDAVAARAASGATAAEIREWLNVYLADSLGGESRSGNRGKTITVLCRIWVNVPHDRRQFRERAAECLGAGDETHRLALHWAMALAVYPFFGEVTSVVGRLLALQGEVERQSVLRRLAESWGDRPAVSRAGRAVWTSIVNWGVLEESDKRGVYTKLPRRLTVSPLALGVLAEGALLSVGRRSIGVDALPSLPALFPFEVCQSPDGLRKADEVVVIPEGTSSHGVSATGR